MTTIQAAARKVQKARTNYRIADQVAARAEIDGFPTAAKQRSRAQQALRTYRKAAAGLAAVTGMTFGWPEDAFTYAQTITGNGVTA